MCSQSGIKSLDFKIYIIDIRLLSCDSRITKTRGYITRI